MSRHSQQEELSKKLKIGKDWLPYRERVKEVITKDRAAPLPDASTPVIRASTPMLAFHGRPPRLSSWVSTKGWCAVTGHARLMKSTPYQTDCERPGGEHGPARSVLR